MLGCGYTAVGIVSGVPPETALLGGGLCGLSGMLPDLDSDTGIPLRESMAFAAAIVPALLLDRLRSFNLDHDQIILCVAGMYFAVRFGVTKLIAGRTSHRGMFHSIPAALIFAGMAFWICKNPEVTIAMRYFKAGGVFLGVMSHLVLDEIYSFEVKKGRVRVKRSFGTALKFWGKDSYSNFSTYAKLAIVIGLILGEPAMMERLEGRSPTIASTIERIKHEYFGEGGKATAVFDSLQQQFQGAAPTQFGQPGIQPINPQYAPEYFPPNQQPPVSPFSAAPGGYIERPIEPADNGQPFFQPGVNYFEANANPPPPAPR
jgi:hypothetical protein